MSKAHTLPPYQVPLLHSLDEKLRPPGHGQRLRSNDRLQEYILRRGMVKLYHEMESYINQRLSLSLSLGDADELVGMALQQKEMKHFNKTIGMVSVCIVT